MKIVNKNTVQFKYKTQLYCLIYGEDEQYYFHSNVYADHIPVLRISSNQWFGRSGATDKWIDRFNDDFQDALEQASRTLHQYWAEIILLGQSNEDS